MIFLILAFLLKCTKMAYNKTKRGQWRLLSQWATSYSIRKSESRLVSCLNCEQTFDVARFAVYKKHFHDKSVCSPSTWCSPVDNHIGKVGCQTFDIVDVDLLIKRLAILELPSDVISPNKPISPFLEEAHNWGQSLSQTDRQTDRQILWHHIRGYVDFFFS